MTCPTCADLQRELVDVRAHWPKLIDERDSALNDLAAVRIRLAEERDLRQSLEKQRDRLVGLLDKIAERLPAYEAIEGRLDEIIKMLESRDGT